MAKHIPNVLSPFSKPYATKEQRKAHADGLRRLADWIENSDFPIPAHLVTQSNPFGYIADSFEINSLYFDDDSFVKRAGSAGRLMGGLVHKGVAEYTTDFALVRDFGGGVFLRYRISRSAVCEAREIIVQKPAAVPVDGVRAAEIEEKIRALEEERGDLATETREVPITELVYDCPPALLSAEQAESKVLDQAREPIAATVPADEDIPF